MILRSFHKNLVDWMNFIIFKRVIKDHMLAHNLKPYSIDISPAMVKSFKAAHSKYQLYLEEEKKKKIQMSWRMRQCIFPMIFRN